MKEAHDHHRVTPEGKQCGEQVARLTEKGIAKLVTEGEPDERCKTCAFRAGTVPNGCPQTQADVMKCVLEAVPFYCHQRKGELCHGWYAARVALGGKICRVPWDFSPPDLSPSGDNPR